MTFSLWLTIILDFFIFFYFFFTVNAVQQIDFLFVWLVGWLDGGNKTRVGLARKKHVLSLLEIFLYLEKHGIENKSMIINDKDFHSMICYLDYTFIKLFVNHCSLLFCL